MISVSCKASLIASIWSWLGSLTERLLVSGGARELLLSLFLHRDWRYWNRHPLPGPSEASERTISLRPGSGY
jgi:hypothetical protein